MKLIKDEESLENSFEYLLDYYDSLKDESDNEEVEIALHELESHIIKFLNNKYVLKKINKRNENPETFLKISDAWTKLENDFNLTLKTGAPPALEEEVALEDIFEKVLKYNRLAKEFKSLGNDKKSKEYYTKKSELLLKFGTPLHIHSLMGGAQYVLVHLYRGTFHCPIENYTLDQVEYLEVKEFYGEIN